MGNNTQSFAGPVLRLEPASVGVIERAAFAAYPEEACGLMLGRFHSGARIDVKSVVQVPNHAASQQRHHRYEIDPRLLIHWDRVASQAGMSIVGFFHSHPDHAPRPSATDAQLAWPSYAYLIAGVARAGESGPIISGLAAWTFDEASTSFRELTIEVVIAPDQIEYYI